MKKWGMVLLIAVLWLGVTACPHIQEPWTQKDSPFQKDRLRSDHQQAELRQRLMYTQIDR